METEIFKDIPGYEGMYQVSSLGRIFSIKKGIFLKPGVCTKGYHQVILNKYGKPKPFLVHRIVMLAFLGESSKQVNHKDGNKLNNVISNLEYCSGSDNIKHAYSTGLFDSTLENRKVKVVAKKNGIIKYIFNGLINAEKCGLFSAVCISSCLHGRQKTHRGFIWERVEKL